MEFCNNKGQLHREDGPAVERNGDRWWYINGQRHRLDGPAIEYSDGSKHWYIYGKEFTQIEFNSLVDKPQENKDKMSYEQKDDKRYTDIAANLLEVMGSWTEHGAIVFGGFVRDLLANKPFKDIDMCVQSEDVLDIIIRQLRDRGIFVERHGLTKRYLKNAGDPYKVYKYTLTINGVSCGMDAVIGPPYQLGQHMLGDADVNNLAMGGVTKQRFAVQLKNYRTDLAALTDKSKALGLFNWRSHTKYASDAINNGELNLIFDNIHHGMYTPDGRMKYGRKMKMQTNGWSIKLVTSLADEAKKIALNQAKVAEEMKKEEKKNMTTTPENKAGFFDMMKSDGTKAAYRVAGKQMTKGTKQALLLVLEKQGHGKESVAAFASMLDSATGEAVISVVLGLSLTYLPMVSGDPRAQKLAEEFRVAGIAGIGNEAMGFAISSLLPIITQAMSNLPAEVTSSDQKVRIAPSIEQLAEAQDEANTVAAQQATVKA